MAISFPEIDKYIDAFRLCFSRKKHTQMNSSASEDLIALFENEIKPKLHSVETLRLEKLALFEARKPKFKFQIMPAAILVSALLMVLFDDIANLLPIVLAFLVGLAWVYKPVIDYIHQYKEKVMPILVTLYGDINYQLKAKYDKSTLANFAICPTYDYIKTEDYLTGKLDDIAFEFCELELNKQSDKKQVRVFKGGIVILTMPFHFNSHTIVKRDFGKVLNWLTKDASISEKVALENPTFEAQFEAYSNDQLMARYILTPRMMEQLMALESIFQKSAANCRIECEFVGNKAVFMLRYKDNLLEPAWIEDSAYALNALPLIEKELQALTSIASQLNLDLMAARRVASSNIKAM